MLNLTIYDTTKQKSYFVVWKQAVAGWGDHELAFALLKWEEETLKNSEIENIIIWSDMQDRTEI